MMQVTLSDKALQKVKAFADKDASAKGKGLRVYVQGGGCAGFEYGFSFDLPHEGDTVIESGEIKIIVDAYSAPYLKDSLVDYQESLQGAGFVVRNPNAKSTCGCGLSVSF